MATFSEKQVYRIRNAESRTSLMVQKSGTKTIVICAPAGAGDKRALWRILPQPGTDGGCLLKNEADGSEIHMSKTDVSVVAVEKGHAWHIVKTGDEWVIHTGYNEIVMEWSKATNKVQIAADKPKPNQRWIITGSSDGDDGDYSIKPGVYVIRNVKTRTVVDLERFLPGEGINIFGFRENGGANQKWDVQPGVRAPNMSIRSVATNMYAAYSVFEEGATLFSNAKAHDYIITPAEKGYYLEPVEKPGYVVDLTNGQAADETKICLWRKHTPGMEHQMWYFEPA